MAFAFLNIEGVSGESQDSIHKNWIDVHDFILTASQPGSMASGGGGGAGKVKYEDLVIMAHADKATPTIFQLASSGKHIGKVELSVNKSGGAKVEYLRLTLEDVLVTEARYQGLTSDMVSVSYRFQASRIRQSYWEQTAAGGKGAEVASGWDIKQNKPL